MLLSFVWYFGTFLLCLQLAESCWHWKQTILKNGRHSKTGEDINQQGGATNCNDNTGRALQPMVHHFLTVKSSRTFATSQSSNFIYNNFWKLIQVSVQVVETCLFRSFSSSLTILKLLSVLYHIPKVFENLFNTVDVSLTHFLFPYFIISNKTKLKRRLNAVKNSFGIIYTAIMSLWLPFVHENSLLNRLYDTVNKLDAKLYPSHY